MLIERRVEIHQKQSGDAVVRRDGKPKDRKIQLFDECQQRGAFTVTRASLKNRDRICQGGSQQSGNPLAGQDIGALRRRRQPAEDDQAAVAHSLNFTSPKGPNSVMRWIAPLNRFLTGSREKALTVYT